jgi:hypothetical protein
LVELVAHRLAGSLSNALSGLHGLQFTSLCQVDACAGLLYDSSRVLPAGGVVGGVVGGVASDEFVGGFGQTGVGEVKDDLLARDTKSVAIIGTLSGRADALPADALFALEAVPEPVEADMGPGSDHDEPTPSPPPDPPQRVINVAQPGVDEQPSESPAELRLPEGGTPQRGAADGLAAAASTDRCDDPTLVRKSQLDVVFVVDVSTTMTFMLDRIEKQIAQVDAEARVQGLDPRYGLVVFVDDVLVANGGQPYADIAALQADLATWQAFTAGNRQINSADLNLDWPENTLDAVHAAATRFAWRPVDTTLRMVVHATDDDFREAPTVQSGQTVQHTYRDTAAALRAAEVRMFSFAARIGGQCECLDVRPGLFTKYRGQPSLPDATGGAVFDIDAVAAGKLGFSAAVAGAIRSGVCTRYPLAPHVSAQVDPYPQ